MEDSESAPQVFTSDEQTTEQQHSEAEADIEQQQQQQHRGDDVGLDTVEVNNTITNNVELNAPLESVTKPQSVKYTNESVVVSQLKTSDTLCHSTESEEDIVRVGSSEDRRPTAAEDTLRGRSDNPHQSPSETDLMQFNDDDKSNGSVSKTADGEVGLCAGKNEQVRGSGDILEQEIRCRPPSESSEIVETTEDKEQTVRDSCVVSTDGFSAAETLCVKQTSVEPGLSVVAAVNELENVEKCLRKLLHEEAVYQNCLVEACAAVNKWETQHEDCNNNCKLNKLSSTILDQEMHRQSWVPDLNKMLQNAGNLKIYQQHKQHQAIGEQEKPDALKKEMQQGAAAAAAAEDDEASSADADFELVDHTCEDIQQNDESKSMAEELRRKESVEVEQLKKWLAKIAEENHNLKVNHLTDVAKQAADRQKVEFQLRERLKQMAERENLVEQQLEQLKAQLKCCREETRKQVRDLEERLEVAGKNEALSITMLGEVEQRESNVNKELEESRETERRLNTEIGEMKAKLEEQSEELKQVQCRFDETLAHTTQTVQQLQLQLNESTQHEIQLMEDIKLEKEKTGSLLEGLTETVSNEISMQIELSESLQTLKSELEGGQQVEDLEDQLEQETTNVVHLNDVLVEKVLQKIIDSEDELKRLTENEGLIASRKQLAQTEKVEVRLKAELEQSQECIVKLTADYDELKASQNSLSETIKQKKLTADKLKADFNQVWWKHNSLKASIEGEVKKATSLLSTGNLEALQALHVGKNNAEGAEAERRRLSKTVEQSVDRQRELENEQEKCTEELGKLQGQVQTTERELAEMTNRFQFGFRDIEAKMKLETEKQDQLQTQFEQVTRRRQQLETELTPVDTQIAKLIDEVAAFTEDKTKLDETIKQKSQRIETLKLQLKETRHKGRQKYPQLTARAGRAAELSAKLLESLTGVRSQSLEELSESLEKLMSFKSDLENKTYKQRETLETQLNLLCQTNNLPLLHLAAVTDASYCQKTQLYTGRATYRRPVGLVNIGNTCYFSSAMQNIYQTFLLEVLLNELQEKMMTNNSLSVKSDATYELCIRIQISKLPKNLHGKALCLRLTVEPGGVCETEVKKDGTTDEIAVAMFLTPNAQRPVVKLAIFYQEFKGLHTVTVSSHSPTFKEPLSCQPSEFTLCDANGKLTFNVTTTIVPSSVTRELWRFYKHMTSKSQTSPFAAYRPEQLFVKLCHRSLRFINQRQQDSHELLRHLMDAVKEEEKEFIGVTDISNQLTAVDKVFGGQFLTIFNCQHCDVPYHLFEPFLDLSLPVVFNQELRTFLCNADNQQPTSSQSDATNEYKTAVYLMKERLTSDIPSRAGYGKHLLDLLKFYTSQEELPEYLCLECNKDREVTQVMRGCKETLIYNPPAVLTIHFKRFEQSGNQYTKVNEHVRFDTVLDLSPFCSKFSQCQSSSQRVVYYLYGVVVHLGTLLTGGHYIAYIRSRTVDVNHTRTFLQKEFFDRGKFTTKESFMQLLHTPITPIDITDEQTRPGPADTWFEINDSTVKLTTEAEVVNKDAFLLFYERVL